MATKSKKKLASKGSELGRFSEVPWDGTVDEKQLEKGGGPLMAMLYGRAQQLRHSRMELAEYLGVVYATLAQLASGYRKLGNLNEDFRERARLYLGVPRMVILRATGMVQEEDFYEHPENLPWQVDAGIDHMSKDPNYQPYFPPRFLEGLLNSQEKFFLVRLYEEATGAKLLTEKTDLKKINEIFRQINEKREKLLKK